MRTCRRIQPRSQSLSRGEAACRLGDEKRPAVRLSGTAAYQTGGSQEDSSLQSIKLNTLFSIQAHPSARGYGVARTGKALVAALSNSNRRIHSLETNRPSASADRNSHRRAACKARLAKYLLGPGESSVAPTTPPDASTATLTLTLTVPRMVSRAFWGTSGKTSWRTSP